MNCFYHYDRLACAQCRICGKGLCNECANQNGICNNCLLNEKRKSEASDRKVIVLSAILFSLALLRVIIIILLACIISSINPEILTNSDALTTSEILKVTVNMIYSVITAAGIPWGWTWLTKHFTGKFILWLPIIGWIIYLGLKLILAIYIGWMVLIFQIHQRLRKRKADKQCNY